MSDRRERPGFVYTFYSYKGGVGRSMALANVAALLAKWGGKVLAVDWDLEAPGLEVFFQRAGTLRQRREDKPGVVDLLESAATPKRLDWRSCRLEARVFSRRLDVISAGRKTDDYQYRVQNLDWDRLFKEHRIGNYIDDLRQEWKEAYDFVLIDSRTGITDIGDICTVLLPDALVLLLVANYQNIEGIRSLMTRATAAHESLPVNRDRLVGIPVLARDEVYTEYDRAQEWKEKIASELGDLYQAWLPRGVKPRSALNKLFIPYVTNWSFGERMPVIENEDEIESPTSISASYARLARLLESGLDWTAVDRTVEAHEISEVRRGREEAEQAAAAAERTAQTYRRAFTASGAVAAVLAAVVGVVTRESWGPTVSTLSGYLWHPYLMLPLLVGTGAFLSVKLRFVQVRGFRAALRTLVGGSPEDERAEGDISHFQALAVNLARSGGFGSVLGAAIAIQLGGPGALFWMCVAGLVAMATTYAESYLSILYRITDERGEQIGGPMLFLAQGSLGQSLGKTLAMLFAGFTLAHVMAFSAMWNSGEIAATLDLQFGLPTLVTGLLLAAVAAIAIRGGIRTIGRFTGLIVPAALGLFLLGTGVILAAHAGRIPALFGLVLRGAFGENPLGIVGGGLGAAVQFGLMRGVFASGSGFGQAGIVAAAARTGSPARHARVSMLQTLVGSILLGLATGLTILLAIEAAAIEISETTGLAYESFRFAAPGGWGGPFYAVTIGLLGLLALVGSAYVGERCAVYLLGSGAARPYRVVVVLLALLGGLAPSLRLSFNDIFTVFSLFEALVGVLTVAGVLALVRVLALRSGQSEQPAEEEA